jgi:putative peptide zinc metalloprotease protein
MNIREDIEIKRDDENPAASPPLPQLPAEKKIRTGELRSDLEIIEGGSDENGKPVWVISDPVSGNYYRIGEKDHRILSCLSADQELDEFLLKLKASGVSAEQADAVRVLSFLMQNNLMKTPYGHSEAKSQQTRQFRKKMLWQIFLSTYLFFRIPLFSPDRFLVRTQDVVQTIFNRWTLFVIKLLAAAGYIGLIVNFHKFADTFISSISLQGLFRYSAAVIGIKIVHEFAHAYTARYFGCRVRKMGIAFIVFFPRLFTDITDSWRISDRKKRFLVDGAGIICELLIGGVAALVWANTGPGMTNTVSYYVFAVSIMNTVLVNGNPFIRYDGYYMLMDIVNIDNLQKRGTEMVRGLWRKHLFGMEVVPDPAQGWRRSFLAIYSIGSFVYRIFLYTSIILIVYFQFVKAVGIVLLVLELYLLVLKPLYDEIKFLRIKRTNANTRRTALSLCGIALLVIFLLVPLPWRIWVPCEIISEQSVIIYAPSAGFLSELVPKDGDQVAKGGIVMVQYDPFLEWRLSEISLESAIDRIRLDQSEGNNKLLDQASVLREALAGSRDKISELERKRQQQRTASPVDGKFILLDRHIKLGKWLAKGELVGEIYDPASSHAVAYVEEKDMKFIRTDYDVSVYLNDNLSSYSGKISRINPMATEFSPSPLLKNFGGPIIVYRNEAGAFVPVSNYYRIEIKLTGLKPDVGRSGSARITKFSSIAGNIARSALSVIQRELSF